MLYFIVCSFFLSSEAKAAGRRGREGGREGGRAVMHIYTLTRTGESGEEKDGQEEGEEDFLRAWHNKKRKKMRTSNSYLFRYFLLAHCYM